MNPQVSYLPRSFTTPQTSTAKSATADAAAVEHKAREIIAHLNAWAQARPDLADVLLECADEVSWTIPLKPVAAGMPAGAPVTELKGGVTQIVTALDEWAEQHPVFSRTLSACAEELLEAFNSLDSKAVKKGQAGGVVLEALAAGYQTSTQIAEATGLLRQRVTRNITRLIRLGYVRAVGCGAITAVEGNRTRLYELTQTQMSPFAARALRSH